MKITYQANDLDPSSVKNFVDKLPIGVLYLDFKGTVHYANKRMEEISGYTIEEIMTSNIFRMGMLSKKDMAIIAKRLIMRKLGKLRGNNFVYTLIRKDGTKRFIQVNTTRNKISDKDILVTAIDDITDRQESEDRLKASEAKFRTFSEYAPLGIYILNLDGDILYGNKKVEEIVEYKRGELIGKNILKIDLLDKKSLIKAAADMSVFNIKKDGEKFRYNIITKNKNKKRVEVYIKPIKLNDSKVYMGIVNDISKKEMMERELRKSEELLEKVTDKAHDAIVVTNEKGEIVFWNIAAEKLFGYQEEEAINISLINLLECSEDSKIEALQKLLKNPKGKMDNLELKKPYELCIKNKKGEPVEVEASISIAKMGSEYHAVSIIRDISKRKLIESQREKLMAETSKKNEQLEKTKLAMMNLLEDVSKEKDKVSSMANELKKFELAVENASDQIIISSVKGEVLYVNKATERITGYKRDDLIGKKVKTKKIWRGLMSKKEFDVLWDTVYNRKQSYSAEIKKEKKNGIRYDSSIRISPILNSKGQIIFFVGLERDISKEKQIDKMKTEFVSVASHQLRTPLSGMRWLIDMLKNEDLGSLNDEQKEMIGNLSQSNERMIKLVNFFLTISHMESHNITINPSPTDIKALIKDVIEEYKDRWKEKQQVINFDIKKKFKPLNIDGKLIKVALSALLDNAIKYSPPKGSIDFEMKKDSKFMTIKISDHGCGIPEEEQDKVFNKFFRASNITKVETDGSGLGLYLVKSIVKSSSGEIRFKSKSGEGTSFELSLPLAGSTPKKGEVKIENLKLFSSSS